MLQKDWLVRTVRVHPGKDGEPFLARRCDQLTAEITVAKEEGAVVQRVRTRVVGNDPPALLMTP